MEFQELFHENLKKFFRAISRKLRNIFSHFLQVSKKDQNTQSRDELLNTQIVILADTYSIRTELPNALLTILASCKFPPAQ